MAPYISFNAQLTSSDLPNGSNKFSPVYADGSGLVMTGEAGKSTLRFFQKNYGGNGAASDILTFQESMFLNEKGQLGIGFGLNADFGLTNKLAVNGTIVAKKIKVTQGVNGVWPDYVFESSYNLPELDTVELYINTHKHLPGVPSAKEVNDDGLDLGDNQAALLKKVEELTLYVIQMNKTIKEQQEHLHLQNSKISDQNKAIGDLQERLKLNNRK